MIALARQIDRGPWWASGIAAALLLLALLVPAMLGAAGGSLLVSMLGSAMLLAGVIGSAASIALVVLRRGESAIVSILLPCVVLLVGASTLLLRSPLILPLIALVFWLPAIVAAIVLRRTTHLGVAVLVTAVAGVMALLLMELVTGGTVAFWQAQFAQMGDFSAMLRQQPGYSELFKNNPDVIQSLPAVMANLMTVSSGLMAMTFGVSALFLARYWQAALVNPGGFRQEFHSLSIGRSGAIALAVLLLLVLLTGGPIAGGVALLVVMVLCLQGLAVAHALVRERGMSGNWLVGLYLLLLIPHTTLLLAALGLLDNLFPLRQR